MVVLARAPFVITLWGWFPVAAFALYSKYIRVDLRYFGLLHGMSGTGAPATWIDHLSLLRDDIVLGFFAVPLLIIISFRYLRCHKVTLWFWYSVSLTLVVLLFANLHSWGTVGHFLTYTALTHALSFGLQNPEYVMMYIDADSWLKLAALIAVVTFGFFARVVFGNPVLENMALYGVTFVLGLAFLLGVISLSSPMQRSPIMRDFVVSAVIAFADTAHSTRESRQEPESLRRRYQRLAMIPDAAKAGRHFGAAQDQDLIIFVMETTAKRFANWEDDLASFPTVRRLSANGLLATNHHTVFPATAESHFAIFMSVYPPRSYYSTCMVETGVKGLQPFRGFVSALRHERNYRAAIYLPLAPVAPLDRAVLNLGFEKQYFADKDARTTGASRDEQALVEMKKDLEAWISSGQRYVTAFAPQIGHAPWQDRPRDRSVDAHGKYLAQIQDRWLGEIVAMLEARGRLENTLIVVTADHGIRTTVEDPTFRSGFIDEDTFGVPLLVYSNKVFQKATIVSHLTSHIDIAPSLLELFGFSQTDFPAQGIPLWDDRLIDRRTFFLGHWYFGADAYFDTREQYVMYSEVLKSSFSNSRLAFSRSDSRNDTPSRDRALDAFYDTQSQWVATFLCEQ